MLKKTKKICMSLIVALCITACDNNNSTNHTIESQSTKQTTILFYESSSVRSKTNSKVSSDRSYDKDLSSDSKPNNKIQFDSDIIIIDGSYDHLSCLTKKGTLYVSGVAIKSDFKIKDFNARGDTFYIVSDSGDLYENKWTDSDQETYDMSKATLLKNKIKSAFHDSRNGAYITADNELYVWGDNEYGQIGNGVKNDYLGWNKEMSKAVKVLGNVKKVMIQDMAVCALTQNGELYTWGQGRSSKPSVVKNNIKDFSFSGRNLAAISNNNELFIFGQNDYGQFGNGKCGYDDDPYYLAMKDVTSVSCSYGSYGGVFIAATTKNGDLYTWGGDERLTTVHGDNFCQLTPKKIGEGFKSVSLGVNIGYALSNDNEIFNWELISYGNLKKE
ncbi:MAG: hypothetical protein IKH75_14420 [Ruminococcus sp.]|nr:hypothetical protein [Ruminococcus sp.]